MVLLALAVSAYLPASAQNAPAKGTNAVVTPALKTESTSAAESEGARVGTDYELGVGDVIHVSVWREAELTQTAVVRPDGKISLPLAGEIPVAGKTAVQAQTLIQGRLLHFVTEPNVTVSVVEIHSRQVYITGQVQRPGAYPLIGSVNVLQLIASAGGLTQYAHKKGIVILHPNSPTRDKFDYSSEIDGKSKHEGLQLKPGDTVVVP